MGARGPPFCITSVAQFPIISAYLSSTIYPLSLSLSLHPHSIIRHHAASCTLPNEFSLRELPDEMSAKFSEFLTTTPMYLLLDLTCCIEFTQPTLLRWLFLNPLPSPMWTSYLEVPSPGRVSKCGRSVVSPSVPPIRTPPFARHDK